MKDLKKFTVSEVDELLKARNIHGAEQRLIYKNMLLQLGLMEDGIVGPFNLQKELDNQVDGVKQ